MQAVWAQRPAVLAVLPACGSGDPAPLLPEPWCDTPAHAGAVHLSVHVPCTSVGYRNHFRAIRTGHRSLRLCRCASTGALAPLNRHSGAERGRGSGGPRARRRAATRSRSSSRATATARSSWAACWWTRDPRRCARSRRRAARCATRRATARSRSCWTPAGDRARGARRRRIRAVRRCPAARV